MLDHVCTICIKLALLFLECQPREALAILVAILHKISQQFNQNTGMMKLKPLSDRLVVKRLEKDEVTPSGIVLPDTVKEKPDEGEVVAVGPGRLNDKGERIKMDVQVGDKVLFTKYGPTEVKVDGEKLLILNESDVLAIIGK